MAAQAECPYVDFRKDPGGVKSLWERFNAGLIDPSEPRSAHHQLLLNEWRRCRALGVDVAMTMGRRLSDSEFQERLQAQHLLVETSLPIMEDVSRFLTHVPGIVIVTEGTGCILHVAGDPLVRDIAASRSGIAPGSIWDENTAGTNGIGTALIKKRPVHVFASEHFCEGWHSWTCAASPIFDSDGRSVLGVIDFTTVGKDFRDQALALTVSVANSIQARMSLHRELERSWLVNAFGDATRRYRDDELLALDSAGRVIMHTPGERCARIAESWTSCGLAGLAEVRETIEVKTSGTGVRVGSILVLSKGASRGRLFTPSGDSISISSEIEPVKQFGQFMTQDADTRRMLGELERIVRPDVNVLIIGETGTGKELLARHLHERERAQRQTLSRSQLRRHQPRTDGEHVLRLFARRVFRGRPARSRGLFRIRSRGHALPR